MAEGDDSDARKSLDMYLHDYFVKNNMHETAAHFRRETGIDSQSVGINYPRGFLREWWSAGYDKCASRQPKVQQHSQEENSAKSANLEDPSHSGPIILTQPMVNQQRPGQLRRRLLNSLATSSSVLRQRINLAQYQVHRPQIRQDIGLRTVPTNPITLSRAQKGKFPVTGPHHTGLIESVEPAPLRGLSLDESKYQQEFQILNHQPQISPESHMNRNLTPTFPASATKLDHRFNFGEVSCLHPSKSEIICCHFSSDGKFLASAGHEKKVFITNMETLDSVTTSECHSLITDVRFKPSSTIFATSSLDKTLQIWDPDRPRRSQFKFVGHAEQNSLDFHPTNVDLLCSCDSNNEIRLWDISEGSCIRVSKGGTRQVRFQPQPANLMATTSENVVNVFDCETNMLVLQLKGHKNAIRSICWHSSGKFISSISQDCARIWSISSGECLHELPSSIDDFKSCTFHPGHPQLLIVGTNLFFELWDPAESIKTFMVEAHKRSVSSLAASQTTQMVASTSDEYVKIWK